MNKKKTTSDVNGRIFSIIELMGSIFEYIYKKITFWWVDHLIYREKILKNQYHLSAQNMYFLTYSISHEKFCTFFVQLNHPNYAFLNFVNNNHNNNNKCSFNWQISPKKHTNIRQQCYYFYTLCARIYFML